jgi:hypothetical protein
MARIGAEAYVWAMGEYENALLAERDRLRQVVAESEAGRLSSGAEFTTTPETLQIIKQELAKLEAQIRAEGLDA